MYRLFHLSNIIYYIQYNRHFFINTCLNNTKSTCHIYYLSYYKTFINLKNNIDMYFFILDIKI